MSQADRDAELDEAFYDPKKAKNNAGEYEARSADDMITLDNRLGSADAGKTGGAKAKYNGIRMQRASFPPTV